MHIKKINEKGINKMKNIKKKTKSTQENTKAIVKFFQ